MRVLHITNAYPTRQNKAHPTYGIFIKEQIDSLANRGIDCKIIYINAMIYGISQYIKKVPAIIKESRDCDIIHCHHTYTSFVTHFLACPKPPIVTSFLCPRGKEGRNDKFSRLKALIFDYVQKKSICFIDKGNPDCERQYPGKGFYVPNGVDLDSFREIPRELCWKKLNLSPKKYLLFCSSGTITRHAKRYDLFKKTFHIISQKSGYDIDELLLVGHERPMVSYFFNAASVHLLTSDFEGSPNSIKEALACNVPVVATDVGNTRHMLKNVEGCFVSDSNNPEDLACLVMKAMEYDRIKGRDALRRLHLDTVSVADRIIELYKHAIQLSARHAP